MPRRAGKDNNLAVLNPDLAADWHANKNHPLTPKEVKLGSNKKVWWQCLKGHEWEASINSRSYGSGCPYCAGKKVGEDNNLAVLNPNLAAQWHADKNHPLTPDDVMPFSGKKVWWQCLKGHEWEAIISNRSYGSGCPYCAGRRVGEDNNLAVLNPELAAQWHANKNHPLTPEDVMSVSGKKVWWQCKNGHVWEAQISHRSYGSGCPYCAGKKVED